MVLKRPGYEDQTLIVAPPKGEPIKHYFIEKYQTVANPNVKSLARVGNKIVAVETS